MTDLDSLPTLLKHPKQPTAASNVGADAATRFQSTIVGHQENMLTPLAYN
jgi:hypothetical protein